LTAVTIAKQAVKSLPPVIRRPFEYAYGAVPLKIRSGKEFRHTYDFLQASQWWKKEKLEEYQWRKLLRLLRHAYDHVPYYRRIFDERDLKPEKIKDYDDFRKIPVLTKEIVRDNLQEFIPSTCVRSKLQYVTTGGSTGIPMGFYYEKDKTFRKEWAFILSMWKRVGYGIGNTRAILRGTAIQPERNGKFWVYDPVEKTLILSSYHMTDEILPHYISIINTFRPDFFHVYPSSIVMLARYMKEHNIPPFSSVRAVLCSSENLYPWQLELLQEVFQCRVYDFYGNSEMTVLGGGCEVSDSYHLFPEYGFTELIDAHGNLITQNGESGEIISTGFNNSATPFIRYRTLDRAVLNTHPCSCGRAYPLLERIDGRLQELIVSKNNRKIMMAAINMHSDVFDNVKEFQFYQDEPGHVVFRIVRKDTYSEKDTGKIRNELEKKLGSCMDLEIAFVDGIERSPRGKYRILIQKLDVLNCD
jgi:phenylacetate-CoA ligase